jgi:hypothetical protein
MIASCADGSLKPILGQEINEFSQPLTVPATPPQNLQPHYNVSPTNIIDIIVLTPAGREIRKARWGLVPPWHKGTLKQIKPHHNARIEDYGHVGLTLRAHPVSFLREDLRRRRIVTCREAMEARDGRWLEAAGIVLVRQRPGSAKGVMFITLEDESGIANLVVWAKVFEQYRRVVLGSRMIAVRGRIQREGDVVHLVAQRLIDLSTELASISDREATFPLRHGRGDQVRNGGSGPDPREFPMRAPDGSRYDPYRADQIRVRTRDFR